MITRLILCIYSWLSSLFTESLPEPQKLNCPNAVKVRSSSEILSVINKSANPTSNDNSAAEENCTKNEGGSCQSTEFEEASNSFPQNDHLSPLAETSPNIPYHSNIAGSKNSLGNGRSFSVPSRQVGGAQRVWNRPQVTDGYPSLNRGTPGEENQAPSETR